MFTYLLLLVYDTVVYCDDVFTKYVYKVLENLQWTGKMFFWCFELFFLGLDSEFLQNALPSESIGCEVRIEHFSPLALTRNEAHY